MVNAVGPDIYGCSLIVLVLCGVPGFTKSAIAVQLGSAACEEDFCLL